MDRQSNVAGRLEDLQENANADCPTADKSDLLKVLNGMMTAVASRLRSVGSRNCLRKAAASTRHSVGGERHEGRRTDAGPNRIADGRCHELLVGSKV